MHHDFQRRCSKPQRGIACDLRCRFRPKFHAKIVPYARCRLEKAEATDYREWGYFSSGRGPGRISTLTPEPQMSLAFTSKPRFLCGDRINIGCFEYKSRRLAGDRWYLNARALKVQARKHCIGLISKVRSLLICCFPFLCMLFHSYGAAYVRYSLLVRKTQQTKTLLSKYHYSCFRRC